MAKKKRRITEEPIEEYEFHAGEFDEREFIYKDVHGTKILAVVTVLALFVGIVGAAICYKLDTNYAWVIATLLSFAVCYLLKRILLVLGFRPDLIDSKSMLANYFLYLCLALGICVLFVNPPFFA